MTPTTQAHILHICAQIEAKGLTISSGLVKAKLREKIPLQQILAGIAAYKSGVRADKTDITASQNDNANARETTLSDSQQATTALVQQQQVQIKNLINDVAELKRQILALQKHNHS